jgi:hypothetical protein
MKRNRLTRRLRMSKRRRKLAAMAAPRIPTRGKKAKPLESEYLGYFVPPPPVRSDDEDNYSLEQPSHLKWVPSETTYGVGPLVEPSLVNA